MYKKTLAYVALAAVAVGLLSAISFAQAGVEEIEGVVKLQGKDGMKPVTGALIDIYRTDIKGHWTVKTDKNGHYIRLGMAITGVYLVVASGPGIMPTWVNNIHLSSQNNVDIVCNAGDGSTLSYEEVQKQIAGQHGAVAAGGGAPAGGQPSAADKAKAEAAAKANAEISAKNEEIKSTYNAALGHFKQAVALKQQKDLPGALAEFQQAAAIDPTKQAAFAEIAYKSYANAAQINYDLGVDLFNAKKRDEAKPHFETAVDQVTKATNIAAASPDKDKPAVKNDMIINYDLMTKNVKLLVEFFGEVNRIDDTVKAMEQVEALDLPANKNKWELVKGDLYRAAGKTDEATAVYKGVLTTDPNNLDALYGLGLNLIASPDKNVIQQAANYLADFLAKAPPTDKRVPEVKSGLDALKAAANVEPEKSSKRKKGGA